MGYSFLAGLVILWTTAAFGFGIYDTANQVAPGVDFSWVLASQKAHPEVRRTISTATFYIEGASATRGPIIPRFRNEECGNTMASLRAAGIDIAYYVPTANRTGHSDFSTPPTIEQLHRAIDKIRSSYPEANVIYFDEVGLKPSNYLIVRAAAEYARANGLEVDLGAGRYPLDDFYLTDIDYRLVLMEQLADAIVWKNGGKIYPDDARNPTPTPPNYMDYLGRLCWIPSAEWIGEQFNPLTPAEKRALVFYLSVPFHPSPSFDPPLSWITKSNLNPYVESSNWIWVAAGSIKEMHLMLAQILSSLANQRTIIVRR